MKLKKKILSVLLAVVLCAATPLSVFAAGPKYVSDVMVCEASDFEEAKAELESMGYEIVRDGNLNAALSDGIYLGYKTTDDPDEALTDIAAMNMLGDYSYGDYEELMEKYRDVVYDTVRSFETAIAEFQTNFANGAPQAQMAYDAVNVYRDDDSGRLMGDYLLDYDFSAAAQEQLTDTIMQANSSIVMTIMQTVAMAVDPENTTLLDRLSASGPDALLERYTGINLSVAKAQRAMDQDFSEAADALRGWWNDFYGYLCELENEALEENADGVFVPKENVMQVDSGIRADALTDVSEEEKDYLAAFSDVTELAMLRRTAEDVSLYLLLSGTPYGDGSMLDFFKRPLSEVETIELYALADAMSEAQRAQLEILGIRNTLIGGCIDLDGNAAETQEVVDENAAAAAAIEPVSIFTDVDRSVFEDGVALTGRAEQHEQQSGENWLSELTGIHMNRTQLGIGIAVTSVVSLGTLTAGFVMRALEKGYKAPYKGAYEVAVKEFETAQDALNDSVSAIDSFQNLPFETERLAEAQAGYNGARAEYQVAERRLKEAGELYENAGKNAGLVKCAAFIMFAIAFALDILFIVSFFTTNEPAEANVPHHLVSAADTAYGEDYVYYEMVKNQDGGPADVNGSGSDRPVGWLVLYQTREKGAGKPILARDLRVMTGSASVDEDTSYIHMFDQTGALNLTDARYTGKNDSVNGTYVLFSRDANAYSGSAISGGIAALCAAGGMLVGLCGGFLIAGRKKKPTAAAEA